MGGMGIVGKGERMIPMSQPLKDVKRVPPPKKKKNHKILNGKIENTILKYIMNLRIESTVEEEVVVFLY